MLLPGCPPGAEVSSTTVRSPSDAPYTAAASPAGPPNHQVVNQILQRLPDPDRVGEFPVGGIAQKQHRATGDGWHIGLGYPELLDQTVHIRIGFQVHPREEYSVFG
jgi:hypothetical protein